ncbi:MAG: hypothetical protein Q8M11_12510 [Sulfuritalea sp.]|jgi:hypothetical protein|nr:hypothetical protein [Sulfuritalea sp.]MDP1983271.1 hypothetical protein [Sulfuritalea sp.]
MTSDGSKTILVTVSSGDGDRNFTVNGLSIDEVKHLLSRASEGRFFKVAEVDTQKVQDNALGHLADATGILAVVFIVTAFAVRRLQRRMQG